jgi:peroxiredoxin
MVEEPVSLDGSFPLQTLDIWSQDARSQCTVRIDFMQGWSLSQSRMFGHKSKMEHAIQLFDKLSRCAEDSPEWLELYDDFVERLVMLEAGKAAPEVGTLFPSFALPDHQGRYRSLESMHADGPLVISFNRGGWCPYCVHEIESWRDAVPELAGAGAKLVIIAGEASGRNDSLVNLMCDKAIVLNDVDHGVTLGLGLAFYAGPGLIARYYECGLDLSNIYGSNSGILPIPATFVVDRQGVVRFAFVEPDFRIRAEPSDVIQVVKRLTQ